MRGAIRVLLIGALAGTLPATHLAFAQSPWPAPPPIDQRWPADPPEQQQPKRAQQQPQPRRSSAPPQSQMPQTAQDQGQQEPAAKPRKAAPVQPARAIACSGPFAKSANHLQLAAKFGAENVAFTDVDGPNGAKLKASVLFPKDPKRRVEVWWGNEAARSDVSLIVINGQSTWAAPKGVRLGQTLAALEKLNGKPFMLSGFDADNASAVTDWQDGALATLPGGCKVSVRFAPGPKAPAEARTELSGDKTVPSTDVNMRAVAPKSIEILIGY